MLWCSLDSEGTQLASYVSSVSYISSLFVLILRCILSSGQFNVNLQQISFTDKKNVTTFQCFKLKSKCRLRAEVSKRYLIKMRRTARLWFKSQPKSWSCITAVQIYTTSQHFWIHTAANKYLPASSICPAPSHASLWEPWRSGLTETLIKTMKLVIILEFQSSALVVMRPHRSAW